MIHSNQGIRFDGVAHNIISSSVPSFEDPDHSGGPNSECTPMLILLPQTGINDSFRPNEAPPTIRCQTRSDVFQAGRKVNQPVKNFNSLDCGFESNERSGESAEDCIWGRRRRRFNLIAAM